MAYDILDLDGMPRDPGVLHNRINEARYQRKRARRRRILLLCLLVVTSLGALGCYGFAPHLLTVHHLSQAVAGLAFIVLVGSLPRALRSGRRRPAATVLPRMQEV
jgi:O-antigen/teichoic acid export membrane protein